MFDGFLDLKVGRQNLRGLCGLDRIFVDGTPGDGSRTLYTDMASVRSHRQQIPQSRVSRSRRSPSLPSIPPQSLPPPRLCRRNRPQRKLYRLPQSRNRHSLRKQSQHQPSQQNVCMSGYLSIMRRLDIGELELCAIVGGQCMATRTG